MFIIPSSEVAGMVVDPSVPRRLGALGVSPAWLRVAVLGGGCSGFQYDIRLDAPAEEDAKVEFDRGIGVLVDPISAPYLEKAVLRFEEDLTGSRFRIDNPNAVSSCGCGLSFSL